MSALYQNPSSKRLMAVLTMTFICSFTNITTASEEVAQECGLGAEDLLKTEPAVCELRFTAVPDDIWAKSRLVPSLVNERELSLVDAVEGEFDDASFWELKMPVELPHGRKVLSFELEVGAEHRPLWGQNLLQPLINGKEATPALDDEGVPTFEKVIASDGKGFVTTEQVGMSFDVASTVRRLSSFSFMTAGAEGYDLKIKNPVMTVWPEKDNQVFAQRPRVSELGYLPGSQHLLLIDWHNDPESRSRQSVDVELIDPDGRKEIRTVSIPLQASAASGSAVSQLRLADDVKPGRWTLRVPSSGERTKAAEVAFTVHESVEPLRAARDAAWGAFYWIDNTDNGPYPMAHPQDAKAEVFDEPEQTRDVSGGWFDAGDYGKYSVNTAYSVSTWLLTGLLAPDALAHSIEPIANAAEPKVSRPDWLSVASVGLDWLLKMQHPESGGVHHKATTKQWPAMNEKPHEDTQTRWVMPVTSTATADFAAVMSLAAFVYQQPGIDDNTGRASRYQQAAERALEWLDKHPELVMTDVRYNDADYGGPYDDTSDADERMFARTAYALLMGKNDSLTLSELKERASVLKEDDDDLWWGRVDLFTFWTLYAMKDELDEERLSVVENVLQGSAHRARVTRNRSPWFVSRDEKRGLPWGSNSVFATVGWHWLLWSHVKENTEFAELADDQVHWFFGRNALGKTFVTGEFPNAVKAPHFRPWSSGAIELPAGFLAGGPNSDNLAGDPTAAQYMSDAPMRRYADEVESYATNEVAINWQSVWSAYLSLLVAHHESR